MFKKLFKKNVKEEVETAPIDVQKRKMERFSEPLIYPNKTEEDEDEEVEVKKEPIKKVIEVKKEVKKEVPQYQNTVIISPILGSKESEKTASLKSKKPKKAQQHNSSSVVNVISPYFGSPVNKEQVDQEVVIEKLKSNDDLEVEDNLRNFAKIVEEEQNELKIIEQRTGEFKLDFSNTKNEKEPSFIDEIEDDMSLDELMSLYEKKFND